MGPHHPLAVGASHAKLFTCTTPSLCVATTTQDLASQPSVPVHTSITAAEANTQLKPALLRNQPNRSELSLHDLSSPTGHSVNDGILREDFSPKYDTVDMAISAIMAQRPGSFLTKVDVRSAFRLCPVRPADWHLLGIYWDSQYYYDRVLPFGLHSAPVIFNKFADSLQWILQHTCHLPHVLHYLGDFLDIAGPNQELAETHHDFILDMLKYLHVPVAPEKIEGPATCLTFLGIELDTVALEMWLPLEKKVDFLGTVGRILETNHVTSHELASVVGKLSFASRAIPAGRTFLRRLYDFMRATSSAKPYLSLILPDSARDDLVWWAEALTSYSGRSFFYLTSGRQHMICSYKRTRVVQSASAQSTMENGYTALGTRRIYRCQLHSKNYML